MLRPLVAVGGDQVGAVGLIVVAALAALEARPDLSTDADAIAHLHQRYLGASPDDFADNLVADGQGKGRVAPAAVDGVDVAGADTTALYLDIDIVIFKELDIKLSFLDFVPFLDRVRLEAGELFVARHGDGI